MFKIIRRNTGMDHRPVTPKPGLIQFVFMTDQS